MAYGKPPVTPDPTEWVHDRSDQEPSEPVAAVEAAPEAQSSEPVAAASVAAPNASPHYSIGSWGGIEQYICSAPGCHFDALKVAAAEDHWDRVHRPAPVPRAPSGLVAADGSSLASGG